MALQGHRSWASLDLLIVIISMIGGLLGFFVFNHKPAKIFMGDVEVLPWVVCLLPLYCLAPEWTLLLIGMKYMSLKRLLL